MMTALLVGLRFEDTLLWRYLKTGQYPGSQFDKAATPAILGFEVAILLTVAAAFLVLPRFVRRFPLRFAAMAGGMLIFEMFTSPMWLNRKLGAWAYLYQDVSWVLTAGWSALVLWVVVLVDHRLPQMKAWRRFLLYLAILTPIVFLLEMLVVNLGIRSYSPEVREAAVGVYVAGVPIEALYYVGVFMTLVISFYKYWALVIDGVPIVPPARVPWVRKLVLTFVGVLLFELMIEPMVRNEGFPSWSYVFHDISLVMSGIWVLVIWIVVAAIDGLFIHWDLAHRFLLYLVATAVVATPLEGFLIARGFRVYGPSAVANFTGVHVPGTAVPIEVVFAIPLYFALVIAFVRCGELVGAEEG
jgi:hypothetical protein